MLNERNRDWAPCAPTADPAASHGWRMGRRRKAGKRQPNGRLRKAKLGLPLPERLTHGAVERLVEPIADDDGRPVSPYRAVSLLAGMERSGSIDQDQRAAGDTFREKFFVSGLAPLRAAALLRSAGTTAGREPNARAEAARLSIYHAVVAVGGLASPSGSVLWSVIGWDRSLSEWALEQGTNGRRLTADEAKIILVFALGDLARHYRIGRA